MTDYCYRHKTTETVLRCGQCGKPICHRCLVHHPVGIRCRDCAKVRPIPTFDVSPSFYLRAVAVAAAIGMLGTVVLLGLAFFLAPLLGLTLLYLLWLGLIGIGYVMGAGVSLSVNRKRGRGLQWVVGVAMVLVFLAISPIVGLSLNSLFGILALGFSLYIAVRQLGL